MLRFVLTRLSLIIPTFFGMTLLAFFLIRLVPGDPIETLAGERGIDAARHARLLTEYGLDQPIFVQYGIYIGKVLHGDLGKGVKWQSNKSFAPSRDFNADDVVFMFERQWKENDPYFKVTSSNHSYFGDMGMPALLKSVAKVDDYTVKVTLNNPEAPFLANLAMQFAGIQSKEYAIAMLKAGSPEKIDQDPLGTGPFQLVQYQKDAIIRFKAFPQYWAGKAKIDDLVFSITPRRLGALGQAAKG